MVFSIEPIAEATEHIEVPFEPNDHWVQLTDELEIQVKEAEYKIEENRIRYSYEIEENRIGEMRIHGISVGEYLPDKIVMGRQMIRKDGKLLNRPMGFGSLPVQSIMDNKIKVLMLPETLGANPLQLHILQRALKHNSKNGDTILIDIKNWKNIKVRPEHVLHSLVDELQTQYEPHPAFKRVYKEMLQHALNNDYSIPFGLHAVVYL